MSRNNERDSIWRVGPKKRLSLLLIGGATTVTVLSGADFPFAVAIMWIGIGLALVGFLVVEQRRVLEQVPPAVHGEIRSMQRELQRLRTDLRPAPQDGKPTKAQSARGARQGQGPREKAGSLEKRLWAGFESSALNDLQRLSTSRATSPQQRSRAFRVLCKWYSSQGEFETALTCIELARVADPRTATEVEQIALEADCLIAQHRFRDARELLREHAPWDDQDPDGLLRLANTYADPEEEHFRLGLLNQVYLNAGLEPLSKIDPASALHWGNVTSHSRKTSCAGLPLVTVIMPAYNAAETIEHALRSVLSQSWTELDVIVVDDASTDATPDVVSRLAASDPRVRCLRHERNHGAYAARNTGLTAMNGDLVTVHDADDWSHPRSIEMRARWLEENRHGLGVMARRVRVRADLAVVSPSGRPKVQRIYPDLSSLMVRRTVTQEIGAWDMVRAGADAEFLQRLVGRFGEQSVGELRCPAPLSLSQVREDSLTSAPHTGILTTHQLLGARRQYSDAFQRWHRSANSDPDIDLRFNGAQTRTFPVPRVLRTDSPSRLDDRDVVLMSNLNLRGGTTSSNLEELKAQSAAGMATGLIHHPVYEWNIDCDINPKIAEHVDGEQVRLLSRAERVRCNTLVIRFPKIAEHLLDDLPEIDAQRVAVIVNQVPMQLYGESARPLYDLELCRHNVEERFGPNVTWYPIGPAVREALARYHRPELERLRLAEIDWTNVIDLKSWRRVYSYGGGVRRPRIGRHSRDADTKWPDSDAALLAAYPDDRQFDVRILGGASVPVRRLGRMPDNWTVHAFDSIGVREFLADLDFYVYFDHADNVEAFGRALLEALAVGVPLITSASFEPLFGDAAIYTTPDGVLDVVEQLMADPAEYRAQVARGHRVVEARFSHEAHVQRLNDGTDGSRQAATVGHQDLSATSFAEVAAS